jgi:hypothetical protein
LKAEGSGECSILIYLAKNPSIYDVFNVRVSSVVKPSSPVSLHLGATVQFKIMDQSEYQKKDQSSVTWSSANPSVIEINQQSGFGKAISEGKADILISNHISAASIVFVSRVTNAEIDESSRKNLVVNTDERRGDMRIRVKLFLQD